MKYILNRDVGSYEKGDDFDFDNQSRFDKDILNTWLALGWLDEMKEEPKSVWDLKDGDKYYAILSNSTISREWLWDESYVDLNYRNRGDVYLTRSSAERELEIRKRMAKEAKEGLGLK